MVQLRLGWNKYKAVVERVPGIIWKDNDYFHEPTGRYLIWERGNHIDGGIYFGASPHEALTVDWDAHSIFQDMYDTALHNIDKSSEYAICEAIYEIVLIKTRLNEDLQSTYENYEDRVLPLHWFLLHGDVLCRHAALAKATFLERAKKDRLLEGRVRFNRNYTALGGHAWAEYINGVTYILDRAKEFYGRPDDEDAPHIYADE